MWLLLTMLTGGRLATRTDRVLVSAFVVEFFLTLGSVLFLEDDGNFLLVRAERGALRRVRDGARDDRLRRADRDRRRDRHPLARRVAAAAAGDVARRRRDRRAAVVRRRAAGRADLAALVRDPLAAAHPRRLPRRPAELAARARRARRPVPRLPTMRGEELQPALARALGDPSVEIVRGRPRVEEGRSMAPVNDEAAARLRRLARRRPGADRGGRLGRGHRARVAGAPRAHRHRRRRRAAAARAQPPRRRAAAARRARDAAAADPARAPHRPGRGQQARRQREPGARDVARGAARARARDPPGGVEPRPRAGAADARRPGDGADRGRLRGGGQAAGAGRAGGVLRDVGGAGQRREVRAGDECQDPRRA